MTNAPTQTGRGAKIAPAYAGACLVLLRGPPGNPGPSTDFSVTDGLRWNGSRIACRPPISQNDAIWARTRTLSGRWRAEITRRRAEPRRRPGPPHLRVRRATPVFR